MPQWEVTDNHTGDTFTIDADETPTQEFVADYLQKQQDEAVKRTSEAFKGVRLSPYEQQSLGMGGRVSEPAMIDAPALIQQIRETPAKLEELGGRAADWLGQRMQEPSGDMPRFQTPEGIVAPSPEDLAKTSEQVGEELSPTALPNWATATGAFERYMPESVKPSVRKIVGTLGGGAIEATGEALHAIAPKTKLGEIGEGIAEAQTDNAEFFTSPLGIATLGLGAAPKLAQRGIALAFSADMGRQVPQLATRLGELLAEPEEKRDWKEISKVIAQGVAAVGFSAASGMHGLAPSRAVPAVRETEAAPLELKESDFPTELQRPEIAAAPRPFFDRQSEALGLGRPSTAPTVEDVRAQRAAEVAKPETPKEPFIAAEKTEGDQAHVEKKHEVDLSTDEAVDWLKDNEGSKLTPFRGKFGGGITGWAHEVGSKITTQAELDTLTKAWADYTAQTKAAMKAKDMNTASVTGPKAQILHEAYQAATGQRLDGIATKENFGAIASIRKHIPDYEPPMRPKGEIAAATPRVSSMFDTLPPTVEDVRAQRALEGRQAAAKVQDEVSKVAKTEGQKPAKEVKGELIDRLEKSIKESPSVEDLPPDVRLAIQRADEWMRKTPRPGMNTADRLDWNRRMGDHARAEMESAKKRGLTQVTIEIPGDGSFTVWNTKEHLGELLKRANRISTEPTGSTRGFSESKPTKLQGKEYAKEAATKEGLLTDEEKEYRALEAKRKSEIEAEQIKSGKPAPKKKAATPIAEPATAIEKRATVLPPDTKIIPPNSAFIKVVNYDGQTTGIVVFPHDGTTEGIRKASAEAGKYADENFAWKDEFYNTNSQRGATDPDGKVKWVVSPNLSKISEVGTPEAAYTLGDIEAFAKDRAKRAMDLKKTGDVEGANKTLMEQISELDQAAEKHERYAAKNKSDYRKALKKKKAGVSVKSLDDRATNWKSYLENLKRHIDWQTKSAEKYRFEAERWKSKLTKTVKPEKTEHKKLADQIDQAKEDFRSLYEKANKGEILTSSEIESTIGKLNEAQKKKMAAAIGSVRRIFEKQQAAPERAARFQEPDTRRVEVGGEEESGAVKPPPEQTEMRLTAEKKQEPAKEAATPERKYFIKDGKTLRQVTLRQAQAIMDKARQSSGLGASELSNLKLFNSDGKQIGYVSYNGRVWEGTEKSTGQELSTERQVDPNLPPAKLTPSEAAAAKNVGLKIVEPPSTKKPTIEIESKTEAPKPTETPPPPVVEPPKPPETTQPADVVEEGPTGQYGIAHRVREERAAAGQVEPVERGEGVSVEDAVQRGRDILAADPQAGEKAMAAFEADGTLLKNANAVTRAHGEQLAKTAEAMRKEHGDKSPEYLEAKKALSEWDKRTKKLQTAWHEAGMEQQGATDLDTGNFVAMERAYEEATGEKLEGDKKKTVEDMTDRKKKVDEEVEKATDELADEIVRKTMTPAERAAFDAANKTVREWAIRRAKAENKQRVADEKLRQATRQVQEDAKARAEAIRRKTTRSAEQRAAAAENLARAKSAKLAKEVADIEVKRVRQRQEVIWKRTRDAARAAAAAVRKDLAMSSHERVLRKAREYIEDLGMNNLDEIRNKIATELGMKVDEVTRLLAKDPKVKFMMDSLWTKKQTQRKLQQAAKRWLRDQSVPMVAKALRSIPRVMFGLKVGFHGTVALGTHAPTLAFDPRFWKMYAKNYAKMYRLAGFNVPTPKMQAKARAYYESQVQDLIRREAPGLKPGEKINIYDLARRAGLQNDPFQFEELTAEGQTGLANTMGRKLSRPFAEAYNSMADMGNRGYSVLKFIRQDMFDYHWNRLPNNLKSLEMAKSIADAVNHATGVTKAKGPPGSEIALFAPRLAASRIAFLSVDPIRAAKTFANWKNASKADKWFATEQIKSKATLAATYMGLLALNQGFLSATNSEQQINMSDPFRADYLKFKLGGLSLSYGNPILTLMRLPIRLWGARTPTKGRFANLMYPDESMGRIAQEYIRSQLSPAASTATTLFTKADFQHRPLPDTDLRMPKRLRQQGVEPYTWKEFVLETAAPIPVEEAMREVFRTGMGMSHEQEAQTLKAIATLSVMLATGARVNEDLPYSGDIPPTPMP